MPALVRARINTIADQISSQSLLLLASHRPEPWAQPARCFDNVARKIAQDGGSGFFGWTFHHQLVERVPRPGYVFITHHAVWQRPDDHLVNVTPYPERLHHPYPSSDPENILFLVDDKAFPFQRTNMITPLPLKFFSVVEGNPALDAYVEEMNQKEQDELPGSLELDPTSIPTSMGYPGSERLLLHRP